MEQIECAPRANGEGVYGRAVSGRSHSSPLVRQGFHPGHRLQYADVAFRQQGFDTRASPFFFYLVFFFFIFSIVHISLIYLISHICGRKATPL